MQFLVCQLLGGSLTVPPEFLSLRRTKLFRSWYAIYAVPLRFRVRQSCCRKQSPKDLALANMTPDMCANCHSCDDRVFSSPPVELSRSVIMLSAIASSISTTKKLSLRLISFTASYPAATHNECWSPTKHSSDTTCWKIGGPTQLTTIH